MKAIGGYLELDFVKRNNFFEQFIHLNTARNALEYVLMLSNYDKIYIPYFTCNVILEPIQKLQIPYSFYDIDDNLEPIINWNELQSNEVVLVTNYFGIKTVFIENLARKHKNIIIDNAQALFAKPIVDIDAIYSPRKFIGMADGGLLYTTKKSTFNFESDCSSGRMSHLLIRSDLNAEAGYSEFSKNDKSLENNSIKKMSNLSKKILESIDIDNIILRRTENFKYLHTKLGAYNKLKIDATSCVPLVYSLYVDNAIEIKKKLIQNKIYCATYWPNVIQWCSADKNSYQLSQNIIALPIDQRYDLIDMNKITSIILEDV